MVVVDLDQVLVNRLLPDITAELETTGVSRVAVSEVDNVARWRRAARLAARQMGWRVRSGISGGSVWVASNDYQPHWNADREATRRVAAIIFTPDWDDHRHR